MSCDYQMTHPELGQVSAGENYDNSGKKGK